MASRDVSGKTVLVTGGNSGIGLEAARALAGRGARVVIGCRNAEKAAIAVADVRSSHPDARVEVLPLDLSSLASVEAAAAQFATTYDGLDVLVNNAGVMAMPYERTVDGFELQFATNHLGHFALTGRLLDCLLRTAEPRVIVVASNAHKFGRLDFDNLDGSQRYRKWLAYGQSKLANLLFAAELDRRAKAAGMPLTTVAVHPGYARTHLPSAAAKLRGDRVSEFLIELGNRMWAQSAAAGAEPTVYGVVEDSLVGGEYIGPSGLFELRGTPQLTRPNRRGRSREDAERLWGVSQELTGVRYLDG